MALPHFDQVPLPYYLEIVRQGDHMSEQSRDIIKQVQRNVQEKVNSAEQKRKFAQNRLEIALKMLQKALEPPQDMQNTLGEHGK